MRICESCGFNVANDNDKFCRKCGKPLPSVIVKEDAVIIKETPASSDGGIDLEPRGKDVDIQDDRGIILGMDPAIKEKGKTDETPNEFSGSGNADLKPDTYTGDDYPQPKKKSKAGLVTAIIIILCLAVGAFAFLAITDSDTDSYTDPETETSAVTVQTDEASGNSLNAAEGGELPGTIEEEDPTRTLKATLDEMHNELPMQIEEGMTMTDIQINGDYILCTIIFDENKVNLLDIDPDVLKAAMKETFAENDDPDIKEFMKICSEAGKGVAYKYVGNQSGQYNITKLSYSELSNL